MRLEEAEKYMKVLVSKIKDGEISKQDAESLEVKIAMVKVLEAVEQGLFDLNFLRQQLGVQNESESEETVQ